MFARVREHGCVSTNELLLGAELVFFSRQQARNITKRLSPVDLYSLQEPSSRREFGQWNTWCPEAGSKARVEITTLNNRAGLHTHTGLNSSRGNNAFGEPKKAFRENWDVKYHPTCFAPPWAGERWLG